MLEKWFRVYINRALLESSSNTDSDSTEHVRSLVITQIHISQSSGLLTSLNDAEGSAGAPLPPISCFGLTLMGFLITVKA